MKKVVLKNQKKDSKVEMKNQEVKNQEVKKKVMNMLLSYSLIEKIYLLL